MTSPLPLVGLLGAGCVYDKAVESPPATDTGTSTSIPDDSAPDSRTTTYDSDTGTELVYNREAIDVWLAEYTSKILLAGACPTEPPAEMMQLDGSLAATVLDPFDSRYTVGWAEQGGDFDFLLTGSEVDPYIGSDGDCTIAANSVANVLDPGDRFLKLSAGLVDWRSGPPYIILPEGTAYQNVDGIDVGAPVNTVENDPPYWVGGAYTLVCLDAVASPAGSLDWGPTTWRGMVLMHLERPGSGFDLFWSVEQVDCGYAEDARTFNDGFGDVYPNDCDGVDNDLDGEVDEGAADTNRNGVPDCGEGVPP